MKKTAISRHPHTNITYYDYDLNWRRISRHIKAPEVQARLVEDMNKYTWGRWRRRFTPGMLPADVDNCAWQIEAPLEDRRPYWRYVTWSACHWLVNFNLLVAQ